MLKKLFLLSFIYSLFVCPILINAAEGGDRQAPQMTPEEFLEQQRELVDIMRYLNSHSPRENSITGYFNNEENQRMYLQRIERLVELHPNPIEESPFLGNILANLGLIETMQKGRMPIQNFNPTEDTNEIIKRKRRLSRHFLGQEEEEEYGTSNALKEALNECQR